jgi:hypothetical protein
LDNGLYLKKDVSIIGRIVGLEWTQITNPMMDLLVSGNKNSKSSSWVAKIQKLGELSLVGKA